MTNGADADDEAVWFWHPLLVSSRRRRCEPDRGRTRKDFADDGDKTNSSPGRARRKPLKPSRRECRVKPDEPVATSVCFLLLHTGCGCVRAPGIPRALLEGRAAPLLSQGVEPDSSGASRREIAEPRPTSSLKLRPLTG